MTPDETERNITQFKDAEGRIKRRPARFSIYVYDEQSPEGRPLALETRLKRGDHERGRYSVARLPREQEGGVVPVQSAQWRHGYSPDHPLRNADITDAKLVSN